MRLPLTAAALLACLAPLLGPALPVQAGPARQRSTQVPDALDTCLSPYFWVKGNDTGADSLPLRSTSAKVAIAGVIAQVQVTQVYKNQGRTPLEAIYVFPGSTRAAVHALRMTIGERVIQAHIREKDAARVEYEEARNSGRSASLLEQQRPNVFQMSVANIMPGDEIRVELSYTELLVPTAGTYEFVYPTVVGPRYSNSPASQASADKWVANPYTPAGQAPLSPFDLQVDLGAGLPIERMACATHKTRIAFDPTGHASLKLDPAETNGGNRDFILKYQLAGGKIQSGLMLYQGQEENFFLLMVQPPKQVLPATLPSREYVFIVDVSGSMHGYPLETSKVLMRDLVSHLRPQDRFNFLAFEGSAAVWSPEGSRPGSPENLQSALAFVDRHNGGGGTEIVPALQKALALPRTPGMSRTFVIATDGYISVEPKVLDVVRENLGDANMFAFGIGTAVNRFLIEGIAHAGMGEPFVVTRPEEAQAEAERFRQYIDAPVLTQVKASFHGFQAYDVEPLNLPDVLAERPVIAFGKWRGEPSGSIEVSGVSGAGPFRQTFQVAESKPQAANAALKYLWARHRIQLLGDYAGLGNAQAQQRGITALGLKYGLLTAYTSFVAVDSQVRNSSGHATQVSQPLPLPEGVSNLALPCAPPRAGIYLSPGVASGRLSKRLSAPSATYAAATVEVVPTALPEALPSADASRLKASPVAATVSTGPLQADRSGLPLATLTREIHARLKQPALVALLQNLPEGTILELRVDAAGHVRSASFSLAFPGSEPARLLLQGWSLRAWQGSSAVLRMELRNR